MTRNGGAVYNAKTVILATGTYLKGRIFMGEVNYSSGPGGLSPSNHLSSSLEKLGIELRRFKTGTPARFIVIVWIILKWKYSQAMKKLYLFLFFKYRKKIRYRTSTLLFNLY